MNRCVDELMNKQLDGWMDAEWMKDRCINSSKDGWMLKSLVER